MVFKSSYRTRRKKGKGERLIMAKNNITNGITKTFHKIAFQAKKHSPEILIGVGVVGVVASTVLACKATTKLDSILNESKKKIDKIHEAAENPELAEKYTEEDKSKDLAMTYTQTGLQVVKLYAPAALLGVASLGCIIGSHVVLRKRNVAIAAAYAAVDKGFKEYRKNVVGRFGEEVDKQLKYNLRSEEVEETVVDEKGKEKKVKKTVNVVDENLKNFSPHAKIFDAQSINWEKNAQYNLMFLRAQQSYANDLLNSRGYLFLNEVFEMLGFEKTKSGQVVGWLRADMGGIDGYVDFGIFEGYRAAGPNPITQDARSFNAAHEPVIILDFNIDGPILDKADIEE